METVELAYDVYECQDTHSDLLPIVVLHGMFWNKYMYRELGSKLCQKTKRKPEVVEKLVMVDSFPFNDFYEDLKGGFVPEVVAQNRVLNTLDPKMSLKEARMKLNKLADLGPKVKELFYKKLVHDLTKDDGKFKWKTNTDFLNKEILEENTLKLKKEGFSNHEILFVRCQDSYNITDSRFEEILKFCPNSRLITIEDTTHLLLLEKVDEFVNAVTDFLGPVCNSEDRI
ncbi:unnamed protein product [Larinioides sclopetarius]|uniref:Uncharacterized protein n=1 Tax=Larinioides sclopetarius TaxID=280406 RepID=A0AAV1ZR14_9ARAC